MDIDTTGLLRRADALTDGWTDAELRARVRDRELARVRRGGYAPAAELEAATSEARHRIAVTLARPGLGAGVVSHASAAALWELPLVGLDLRRVHVTLSKETRTGRIGPERHDHTAVVAPDEVTHIAGLRVTTASRTVVDLARSAPASAAVVCADAALQRGLVSPGALAVALARAKGLPGVNRARRALTTADGRSESPGETLTRLALGAVGALDLQVDITDTTGRFVGRTDLALEEAGLLIEFDGTRKYLAHCRPGQSIDEAVLAEKRWEDDLRALGYGMARVVWSDLANPAAVADLVRRAAVRGRAARERGGAPRGGYRPRPRLGI